VRAKPYPAYKPTATEWLGKLPKHWKAKRLKAAATCWVSNVDKVAAEDEEPVRLCNYTDVYYHDHITPNMGLMETTASSDEIRQFGLRLGDVVITKDSEEWSDIAVPALVVESAPDLVCGYHLGIVRPDKAELLGAFVLRVFQATSVNQQFQVAATGVTRYGLPKSAIGEALVPFPPLDEQHAIASFLDRETARIDSLVAKKRTLIERLKERRTALIMRTVTRGLPPDIACAAGLDQHPRLKSSGIEWLGDVPEHWGVLALSRVTVSRCDGPFGSGLKSEHYTEDEGVRVVRLQNIRFAAFDDSDVAFISPDYYRELGDHDVLVGDVLIAGLGDQNNPVGRACVAPVGLGPAMVKADCFRFRLDPARVLPTYVALHLSAMAYALAGALATGTTRARMNLSGTAARIIALPPLPEQAGIIKFLDGETVMIDGMVAKIETAIDRLLEYRSALITAAVTGKIDVRGTSPSAITAG
jgi:type I restriction enzyme S subunit